MVDVVRGTDVVVEGDDVEVVVVGSADGAPARPLDMLIAKTPPSDRTVIAVRIPSARLVRRLLTDTSGDRCPEDSGLASLVHDGVDGVTGEGD